MQIRSQTTKVWFQHYLIYVTQLMHVCMPDLQHHVCSIRDISVINRTKTELDLYFNSIHSFIHIRLMYKLT